MKTILVYLLGAINAVTCAPDFLTSRGHDTGCRHLSELNKCVSRSYSTPLSCRNLNDILKCANNNGCSTKHKNWMLNEIEKTSDVDGCGFYPEVDQKAYSQCLQILGPSYTCSEISDVLQCLTEAKSPSFKVEMLKERLQTKAGLSCDPFKCAELPSLGNVLVCPKMNTADAPCQNETAMKACLDRVVYFEDKCKMWYQIRKCAGVGRCTEHSIIKSKKDFENKYSVNCQNCMEFQSLDYLRVCTDHVEACSNRRGLDKCIAKIKHSEDKCKFWNAIRNCTRVGECSPSSVEKAKSDFFITYQVQC